MKVILSSHLPGVIDILIPIALPFRNVVELAGDLQTTMKYIEERDWLAQGYYLSLSDKTWKCSDRDRVLFVQNNKFPDMFHRILIILCAFPVQQSVLHLSLIHI